MTRRKHRSPDKATAEGRRSIARISLSFMQVRCDRCGGTRNVGQPCPECEKRPSTAEVDPEVQRRQRVASACLSALSTDAEPLPDVDARSLISVADFLIDWEGRFLPLVVAVSNSDRASSDDLVGSIVELRSLRAAVEGLRQRPWMEISRACIRSVDQLEEVVRQLLGVLAATSMLEAQKRGEAAQRALEAAAAPLAELATRQSHLDLVAGAHAESLLPTLISASCGDSLGQAQGLEALQRLDSAAATIFQQVTGHSQVPTGLGPVVLAIALPASVVLDPAKHVQKARETYQALSGRPDDLVPLIRTQAWQDAEKMTAIALYDNAVNTVSLAAAALNDRLAVDLVLQSAHRLAEGPFHHLVGTVLALHGGRSYERLYRSDFGALVDRVSASRFSALADGFTLKALRHAAGHRDFRVEDGSVVLSVRRPPEVTISFETLLDTVLAASESVSGMQLGMLCALAEAGLLGEEAIAAAQAAFPLGTLPTVILTAAGWQSVDYSRESDEEVLLSGTGSLTNREEGVTLAGVLVASLEPGVRVLTLRAFVNGEASDFRAQLGPFRRFLEPSTQQDPFDRDATFMDCLRQATFVGQAAVSDAELDTWFTLKAAEAYELDVPVALRTLRRLLDLARAWGLDETVTTLRSAMKASRLRLLEP